MKRTARRKTARRKLPVPVLLAAALLVLAGGIAVGGSGMPDQDQTAQEDLSAHIPVPTDSTSPLSTPPSLSETDEPIQTESVPSLYPSTSIPASDGPAPSENIPLPTPTPIPISDDPVPTESTPPPAPNPTAVPVPDNPLPAGDNWALTLVNWEHTLPDGFSIPELTQLRNGHAVDSRAYPALQSMMDDARAAGLQPLICSSLRSRADQEQLFEQEVQNWLARGYARENAEAQAAMWVARPGTSEHQTGLAVDIVDMSYQVLDEGQENTLVQKWLMAHCAEYGFILRYPTNKSDLTGVSYEPWHYRYVGVKAAQEIMGRGLCLEEYLM